VADPDQAFGEQSNWGVPRRSKYQKLSATIVVCHTKEVTFCRSKSGYFCWSNYAIFQGKTTVWKRFISSIQKRFETGPKQWASFFTSYTDLVYLQNVFKRFKSMLRASICHCFGYAQRNQQACPWEWDSYGNPMVNVPWDGMRRDRHKLLWDGNGTDECVPWKTLGLSMGMSFLWESHAKRSMGWDGTGINCYGIGMGQINMSHGQPWKSVKNSVWNAFPTWLEVEWFFLDLEVTTHVPR